MLNTKIKFFLVGELMCYHFFLDKGAFKYHNTLYWTFVDPPPPPPPISHHSHTLVQPRPNSRRWKFTSRPILRHISMYYAAFLVILVKKILYILSVRIFFSLIVWPLPPPCLTPFSQTRLTPPTSGEWYDFWTVPNSKVINIYF